MKWIDVKRRKPPVGSEVLVALKCGTVGYAEYTSSGEFVEGGQYWNPRLLTHWMPLPKPPKVNRHARKKGAK